MPSSILAFGQPGAPRRRAVTVPAAPAGAPPAPVVVTMPAPDWLQQLAPSAPVDWDALLKKMQDPTRELTAARERAAAAEAKVVELEKQVADLKAQVAKFEARKAPAVLAPNPPSKAPAYTITVQRGADDMIRSLTVEPK